MHRQLCIYAAIKRQQFFTGLTKVTFIILYHIIVVDAIQYVNRKQIPIDDIIIEKSIGLWVSMTSKLTVELEYVQS